MGFVFQFHYLLPELDALENVLMPAVKRGLEDDYEPYATELLREFGLGERLHHRPSQLSGGEQQRVAIARALVMKPRYIFADEPTGNLDSVNGEIVMKILRRFNSEFGTSVVFVTHDEGYASMASRRIHLVDGEVGAFKAS
jgi:putative ABC transport system ATP-binding protein/lipoprotein-releasing system ATP-binding protein